MMLKIPYYSREHAEYIEGKKIREYERKENWKRIARSRHKVTVITFDGNDEYYNNVTDMAMALGIRPESLWDIIGGKDKSALIDLKITDIIITENPNDN